MSTQKKELIEAIEANINTIDSSETFVIMHEHDFELEELIHEDDIEGLQQLLEKTQEDIQTINVNSTSV